MFGFLTVQITQHAALIHGLRFTSSLVCFQALHLKGEEDEREEK